MDGTSAEAVAGPSTGAVCRQLDALTGWPRRAWTWGTAAAVLVGLVVAASGHLMAGMTWIVLSLATWACRSVFAAQCTEVTDTELTLRGLTGSRSVTTAEVRWVDVARTDLAAPRLVVHGRGALGIALPLEAVATDPELAGGLRRFLAAVRAGTPIAAEAAEVLELHRAP